MEIWTDQIPRVPHRSYLYTLDPIGVGTPETESLTSYIARLAASHCVDTKAFVLKEIFPRLGKRYLLEYGANHLSTFWKAESARVNGLSTTATDWIRILENLTLRHDLRWLSFSTWSNAMGPRGLLRTTKAWCPLCYEEQRGRKEAVYDLLLWTLRDVCVCPHHRCQLIDRCSYRDCRCVIPFLSGDSRPGYCPSCERWLGVRSSLKDCSNALGANAGLRWQLWGAWSVGELISAAPDLKSPTKDKITSAFLSCLSSMNDPKYHNLGKILGVSHRTLRSWYSRGCSPQLGLILRLSHAMKVSPLDLILGSFPLDWKLVSTPTVRSSQKMQVRRRVTKDSVDIEKALKALSNGKQFPPPSMSKVAKRLDCGDESLRRRFPMFCRRISALYAEYVQKRKEDRRTNMYEQIRKSVLSLHQRGLYPSSKRVASLVKIRTDFRDPGIRAAWRKAKQEIGIERRR